MDSIISFLTQPLIIGSLAIATIISWWAIFVALNRKYSKQREKRNQIEIFTEMLIEKVYDFFEEVVGADAPFRIRSYVINLFLIILIANLLGLAIDILITPFPNLSTLIASPTGNLNFTLALAICSVIITLIIEIKSKKLTQFLKKYLLNPLNLIGTIARVISLAFRLYGNMFASSILLAIIIPILSSLTISWLHGISAVFLIPLVFYLQGALTAIVQAFVFALLTCVFIRIGRE